ncbi:UbiA family prenyltransferase [Olivibacter sp. XZL3]|uniref:UbiA family prenyltransferase n=1 Tax=Olivibacter sp. XZL3 TaxID=1735116 RepID=UPI001F116FC9|nr:UbiA family prenyltransferase [Olivibacter sp. XZL3]
MYFSVISIEDMIDRVIKFVFFGNIFVGILAVALSLETAVQLAIPFNNTAYYLLLFFATMAYYTYAYINVTVNSQHNNPRTQWYQRNARFAKGNLGASTVMSAVLFVTLIVQYAGALGSLHWAYWLIIVVVVLSVLLYYGLLPRSFMRLNIRNTGLLKAFIIGFVWASCVNLFPIIMLKIQHPTNAVDPLFVMWFFVKTFMFCTVNAIMFDIKDYAEDANKQLKTFVVRFGLRNTIFQILIPLLIIGGLSMFFFAYYRHFSVLRLLINLLPFALSLLVAYSMYKRHRILYYLIVIDGLLLIKAICGIFSMQFV